MCRHVGVTIDDVMERFGISKRTAQRMLRVLESRFPDTGVANDSDGRRRRDDARHRHPPVSALSALSLPQRQSARSEPLTEPQPSFAVEGAASRACQARVILWASAAMVQPASFRGETNPRATRSA
jgi:hypothetical protein